MLAILIEDPPVPYAQISARLGIPSGASGPPEAGACKSYGAIPPSLP
jgi:hypothetical protein